jgi:hypothetical protein
MNSSIKLDVSKEDVVSMNRDYQVKNFSLNAQVGEGWR